MAQLDHAISLQADEQRREHHRRVKQYAELIRRADRPKPGDAEVMLELMESLGLSRRDVACDIDVRRRVDAAPDDATHQALEEDARECPTFKRYGHPVIASRAARRAADDLRRANPRVFGEVA
jgi:predicted DsbA family dithiol-disulfide isomerase